MQCPLCSYQSIRSSPFINISIDIPDMSLQDTTTVKNVLEGVTSTTNNTNSSSNRNLSSSLYHINELIRSHLTHEQLDDDNKWNCSHCQASVSAVKYIEYQQLPTILFIHLKRFRFDPVSFIDI